MCQERERTGGGGKGGIIIKEEGEAAEEGGRSRRVFEDSKIMWKQHVKPSVGCEIYQGTS